MFCDDYNIECNRVISISKKIIISSIQLIIEFVDLNHDMFSTILLFNNFMIFKRNFS